MASQMPKKVLRAAATQMTKITNTSYKKWRKWKSITLKKKQLFPQVSQLSTAKNKTEEKKPVLLKVEPEKPVIPAPEPKKEMTMLEKILKVENLQLVVEKRAKLVQTRSELERFQISSNDFNCSMRLNDSDGNVFTTSFTPESRKSLIFSRHPSMQASPMQKTRSLSKPSVTLQIPAFRLGRNAFFMVVKPGRK